MQQAIEWRAIPGHWPRFRRFMRSEKLHIPFGHVAFREFHRDGYIVGPWWRCSIHLALWLYSLACDGAVRLGAARCRAGDEGCYYRDLEWWPRGPRTPRLHSALPWWHRPWRMA